MYEGLDLTHEIAALHANQLGDTVLLPGDGGLDGFAVCHCGAGSEARPDVCFVKFGAVRPGTGCAARFDRLLDACEQLALDRGAGRVRPCRTSSAVMSASLTPAGHPARSGAPDCAGHHPVNGRIAERWAIRDDLHMLRQRAPLSCPGGA
ncbi:hypothetical protein AB0D63_35725 [Kitasatospora sp. NPDC048343]|uniref:hypothetical protein n=1 Tax=Kitasatospora sp. NPDC048343 TaxID=3154717 RepID=UPI0034025537